MLFGILNILFKELNLRTMDDIVNSTAIIFIIVFAPAVVVIPP